MQIIIPASGFGQRFVNAGFTNPKPFIDVLGAPMIERVMENLGSDNEFILVFRKEHKPYVDKWVSGGARVKNIQIVWIDAPTEGAAETILKTADWVREDEPVIVANSDQLLKGFQLSEFVESFHESDAGIVTFTPKPHDPKWSYVKVQDGFVTEVVEKRVISSIATIGIYGWTDSYWLFTSIRSMIGQNIRTNNEYYLAPSYNELVKCNKRITTFHVERENAIGLGTPEDLNTYLEHHK